MPANLQALDAILKTQYLGPIREQIPQAIVLYGRLAKDEDSVVGKNFTIPLHYGRNEGIGAVAEGGALPTAGNQQYKETIVPMRYLYGSIEITGPSIKAARNNEGAFIRAVESEMKGLAKDLKTDFNRMVWGDGSGILAVCGNTTTSTTVNVASTKFLRAGMKVDIIKISDGTTGTGKVGAIIQSVGATSIVIDTSVSTDNTYAIYRAGARNLEIMGLQGIFSDTKTLQNLDVATYPWWKANRLHNGGTPRAISEILMQTAMDTSEINDGEVTALYTSFGVRRAYQALLAAMKQYVNPLELKGGYKALDYNGKPLIADKDAPANKIYFADENELSFYRLSDFEWMEEDGAVLHRVQGKDAYGATMYKYCELGCSRRNVQTVLEDITEA